MSFYIVISDEEVILLHKQDLGEYGYVHLMNTNQ